jgi:DNA-binding response OmpR family regulator
VDKERLHETRCKMAEQLQRLDGENPADVQEMLPMVAMLRNALQEVVDSYPFPGSHPEQLSAAQDRVRWFANVAEMLDLEAPQMSAAEVCDSIQALLGDVTVVLNLLDEIDRVQGAD